MDLSNFPIIGWTLDSDDYSYSFYQYYLENYGYNIFSKNNGKEKELKHEGEKLASDKDYVNEIANSALDQNYLCKDDYIKIIDKLKIRELSGRKFGEGGSFISGGERQKIAFGRFLLKSHYDMFVLDEPFTNLDAIMENELLRLSETHLKFKMGVVISHKFNVLKLLTTRIIVVHNGEIVEEGSHEKLLKSDGLYSKLYNEYQNQKV